MDKTTKTDRTAKERLALEASKTKQKSQQEPRKRRKKKIRRSPKQMAAKFNPLTK